MIDQDEMLFYLNEYYEQWLESSIKYYFFEDGMEESTMTDAFWTGLAKNYKKHIKHFPFLESIDFDGCTLGVGVTKEQLVEELNRVRFIKEK